MTMAKEEVRNLNWNNLINADKVFPKDAEWLYTHFKDTLWFYNSGEWDYSEYYFEQEKKALLNKLN